MAPLSQRCAAFPAPVPTANQKANAYILLEAVLKSHLTSWEPPGGSAPVTKSCSILPARCRRRWSLVRPSVAPARMRCRIWQDSCGAVVQAERAVKRTACIGQCKWQVVTGGKKAGED